MCNLLHGGLYLNAAEIRRPKKGASGRRVEDHVMQGHGFAQVLVFSYWSVTVSANTTRHLRLPCLLKATTQKPMVPY